MVSGSELHVALSVGKRTETFQELRKTKFIHQGQDINYDPSKLTAEQLQVAR